MAALPGNRRAAAAILLADGPEDDLRIFLVERAKELRFFGGYWALPGGTRGPEDGPDGDGGDDVPALKRCASRELLEETGVSVDTSELVEVCRIETPPFAPVRYDTLFVLAKAPAGSTPAFVAGELVGGRYWRAAEALAAWRRGELLIVPPVLILLELMLEHGVGPGFLAATRSLADSYRAGSLHRVRFAPGILMASVASPTLPPATTTNCYLVGTKDLYVVDPGTHEASEISRLRALIDELVTEGMLLRAVLLTHHHPDHVGAVVPLSQHYGVPVHAHPLTLDRLPAGFLRGQALADGDTIELGTAPDGAPGWRLEAVFTPGHDKGHLCFRESRYASVLVGDMLSTVSTIVIDPPEGHLRSYLDSLERLLREPMATLHPAHGPAARDGHRLVRQYLRHRSQREASLVQALAEGPATLEVLLPRIYWDVDQSMYPIAARSLLAGAEKLAEEGRARLLPDGRWMACAGGAAGAAAAGG